MLTYH